MTAAARIMRVSRHPVHSCGWLCTFLAGGWESTLIERLAVLATRLHRHPGYIVGASTARLRIVRCALDQVRELVVAELEQRALREMRR